MEVSFGEKVTLSMTREERDILLRKSVGRLVDSAKSARPLNPIEANTIGKIITKMTMYPNRRSLTFDETQLPMIAACLEHDPRGVRLTENESSLATEAALLIRGEISLREPEMIIPDFLPDNFS